MLSIVNLKKFTEVGTNYAMKLTFLCTITLFLVGLPVSAVAETTPSLTKYEIRELRNHIANCWNLPIGASDQEVDIFVKLKKDGTVEEAKIVDEISYNKSRGFRAASRAAVNAIISCQPLPLPMEKYESWKEFTFAFNPNFLKTKQHQEHLKNLRFKSFMDICDGAVKNGVWLENSNIFVQEARRRGLDCGVEEKANTTVASADAVSSDELRAAQEEADRLRDELAALKTEQAREQQTVASDNQIPLINASARNDSETNALVVGTVTDNVEVAELTIDGEPVLFNSNGSFEVSFYVPRNGKTIEIVAFDRRGNSSSKTLKLERGAIQQASGPIFSALNPSTKRVVENPNALALIVGIADYERTDARAAYADKDAQTFYDYARMKLGVPARNIKEFVNDGADELEVILAVKDWIARSTKSGQSDVYVFFAGHGLASDDGEKMYLLPYDGSPRLLEESAISRDVLFQDIAFANPRSVTVFLDTCYSGTTRGTDMLIASRPIAIRAKQSPIPEGFTVFTAAGSDQTAKPLEEAKHGMFSYFLMKGMEGDADANNDNQITAAELHQYVEQNVVQQSAGSQVPELQGDSERVLVRFQ